MKLEPISTLAESLSFGELLYTEAHWRRVIGNLFDTLLESGLLRGPSIVQQIPCELCDQPGHLAFVHYDPSENGYLVTCVVAGSVHLAVEDVELWSFTSNALIAIICDVAGIENRAPGHRTTDDLIPLGTANLGMTAYGIYLLPKADDPETLNEFLRRNRTGFGIDPSIVLCAHKPLILPEDMGVHSIVEVGDLLVHEAGAFRFRTKLLRQALNLGRTGNKTAPVLNATVSAFLRYLRDHNALPSGEKKLRNAFEEYGPDDMSTPGRSTLFKAKRMALDKHAQNPKSTN